MVNLDEELLMATKKEAVFRIKATLFLGADVNTRDSEGWTPLIHAMQKRNIEIMRLLLKKGADPNIKSDSNSTALMYAAWELQKDFVKLLIENGADVFYASSNGFTRIREVITEVAGENPNLLKPEEKMAITIFQKEYDKISLSERPKVIMALRMLVNKKVLTPDKARVIMQKIEGMWRNQKAGSQMQNQNLRKKLREKPDKKNSRKLNKAF